MLEINDITKQYKDKKVLKNISLKFDNGIHGLLGANGAGKTTLLSIISGVVKQNSGTILFNGTEASNNDKEYRAVLGYVPQKVVLYPNLRVRDYLEYMCVLKEYSMNRDEEIDRVLHIMNLSDVKMKKIKTLSGGMQQRLLIAQALIGNPKLILLDEPTVGLDPEERIRLKEVLKELGKEAIVIISTHILSDVSELADTLCVFKKGELIYQGERQNWEQENIDSLYMKIMEEADA